MRTEALGIWTMLTVILNKKVEGQKSHIWKLWKEIT